MFSDMRCY